MKKQVYDLGLLLQSRSVAREALATFGSAKQVLRASNKELRRLGVTASALAGLRAYQRVTLATDDASMPEQIYNLFGQRLAHLPQEVFAVVGLNARSKAQGYIQVAQGKANCVDVDMRDVFRAGLRLGAPAIVVMHNHPSGESSPSREDHLLTLRLIEAGKLLNMPVMDHLVVTDTAFTSIQTLAPQYWS